MQLAVVELFNPIIHGIDDNSSSDICEHFLVHTTGKYTKTLKRISRLVSVKSCFDTSGHPLVRNYKNVILQTNRLQLVRVITLPKGDERVAILTTCWLRIFQRKVKNYLSRRKIEILHRILANTYQFSGRSLR